MSSILSMIYGHSKLPVNNNCQNYCSQLISLTYQEQEMLFPTLPALLCLSDILFLLFYSLYNFYSFYNFRAGQSDILCFVLLYPAFIPICHRSASYTSLHTDVRNYSMRSRLPLHGQPSCSTRVFCHSRFSLHYVQLQAFHVHCSL